MIHLLRKEMKLSASKLSFLFIAFGLMTFLPGYPILVGTFFVALGIFQTFQAARESNDIAYSILLPIPKAHIVQSRYIFCVFIELCAFIINAAVTLIRMTVLSNAAPYRNNALMNANFVYLAFVLLIFGCFNAIFVRGYFKTAYRFAKPFVAFMVVCFLIILAAESLHYIPPLKAVNAFGFEKIGLQTACLVCGILLYIALTGFSLKRAIRSFEKIDL